MKRVSVFVCVVASFLIGSSAVSTRAAGILFMVSDAAAPINADPGLTQRLMDMGHSVTLFTTAGTTPQQQIDAALMHDLVLISESIGSGSVVDASGFFTLKNTAVPVISFEVFMWDNADWTGRSQNVDFGATGRPGDVGGLGLGDLHDNIYITSPGHPLAAGLPAGSVAVYTQGYSVNFGIPGPQAQIAATADAAGNYPTTFIYPAGSQLKDGFVTPAARIGLYLGQSAAGNPANPGNLQFSFLSAQGLALFDAAIATALVPEPTAIALAAVVAAGLAIRRRSRD